MTSGELAKTKARNDERRRKWQPMKSAAYADVLVGTDDVDALLGKIEEMCAALQLGPELADLSEFAGRDEVRRDEILKQMKEAAK